jgi:hypothetical protein
MKFRYIPLLIILNLQSLISQEIPKTEIYLLTCGPGTETYSVYGHSALRIVIPESVSDLVYNWGVFDFNTPNFAWKFAQGKLNYMLGVYPYERFLKEYYQENRYVISQKLNLEEQDIGRLFNLLRENLKPENISYRYDFYYDNCSTRIRDMIEKAIGEDLLYPPEIKGEINKSFRNLTAEYEKGNPWTKFGIDLLIGSRGDIKATFRERMFLPLDLKNGLSELVVRRHGKTYPVLQNPDVILDFDPPVLRQHFFISPLFIFSIVLIVIIILTALIRNRDVNKFLDLFIFFLLTILSLFMIFSNFISAHPQLKWNLNILWLNPVIIICFASLVLNRDWTGWFRVLFYLTAVFLPVSLILPQQMNKAFFPLILILILRCSIRARFNWNPLTLSYLTQF